MTIPLIPTAAGIALLVAVLYKFVIYPAFLSSLARIPGAHWSASISPAWILFHRQQQNDTFAVHAAHNRLGPIIRLAPNEVSVNSVDGGIRTVYSGGFEKGDWYSNSFSNYGVRPMFAMEENRPHSQRKRMLSNIYAKSTLQTSPALIKITDTIINGRLIPRLQSAAQAGQPTEFYDLFSATVMDFVADYIFGLKNGSDFILKPVEGAKFFHDFKARQRFAFWQQEMPGFSHFMKRLGLGTLLVPEWVNVSNQDIEDWVMSMSDGAEKDLQALESSGDSCLQENYPTVYAQLRNALRKEAETSKSPSQPTPSPDHRIAIASELLDHTLAGFDTSGITLTWLAWQLSRPHNSHWQTSLRAELAPLSGSLDAKTLDNLPVLHAILMETLRLHAAIPGNQPRLTPTGTLTTIGSDGMKYTDIPPGVRVQAQAHSLHRNPTVFPSPETWDPARWLPSSDPASSAADELRKREMSRYFWAFGSGGRMCVGSNLAMLDMKATIAGVWGRFTTEVVEDEGMVANGGYMAEPLGVGPGGRKGIGEGRRFLMVKVREVGMEV